MEGYKPSKEEKERILKELQELMEQENPKPRNRAERRRFMKKKANQRKVF